MRTWFLTTVVVAAVACLLASVLAGAVTAAAAGFSGISGSDRITTIAGNGKSGYSGDGGPATSASLAPRGSIAGFSVAVDRQGNVFIPDTLNQRVREASRGDGKIRTIAGTGERGYSGDGGPATSALLYDPQAIAVDQQGNVYFGVNAGTETPLVRKVSPSGTITTFAGGGRSLGDGGPATSAKIGAERLAVDGKGNLYISDGISRVRKVSPDGTITTFAGGRQSPPLGDGGPATAAQLSIPTGVAVDGRGNVYIAEFNPTASAR